MRFEGRAMHDVSRRVATVPPIRAARASCPGPAHDETKGVSRMEKTYPELAREAMSRRTFITAASASAAFAAAASMAGVALADDADKNADASKPHAEGSLAAANQAAGTANAYYPTNDPNLFPPCAAGEGEIAFVAEPIADADIVATYDVDVVVCGLGPAGDAAALSCADHGLKTVAVEKRAIANYCSATLGGTNSKIHKHWGVEFDEAEWLHDAMVDNGFRGNFDLYKRYLECNGEAVDWYVDHLMKAGDKTEDDFPLTFNAMGDFPDFRDPADATSLSRSWNTSFNLPFTPADLYALLPQLIEEAGAEVRYECPACQLVTDENGAVTGVIVKSAEGYEKYNCAKGVVLATGGYGFNLEKLQRCCRPRDLALCGWMSPSTGNTGDGHEMAVAIGGIEDEYPHPLMLDPMQLMPYLRVNKLGKRFTPEYEPYNHLACAIQAQPGACDYYIVDGAIADKIDAIWTPSSSCYGPKEVWVGAATSENALKADTLEELAELMGVPADAFVATIEHWNEMCDAGEDSDFHFPGAMMAKIDTPPFYANLEGAEALSTAGGLQVDIHSRVLNTDFQPIQGLFAVGLTSGGMFNNTYPHNLNCLSHTRNCTFGYLVGKYLSGDES